MANSPPPGCPWPRVLLRRRSGPARGLPVARTSFWKVRSTRNDAAAGGRAGCPPGDVLGNHSRVSLGGLNRHGAGSVACQRAQPGPRKTLARHFQQFSDFTTPISAFILSAPAPGLASPQRIVGRLTTARWPPQLADKRAFYNA